MAAPPDSAEQVQREMREVRAELRENVQDIVDQAGELTDWQAYVKAYPLLSVGAAAAIGYLLIPSRPTVIQPNPQELMALVKSNQIPLRVEPPPMRPGIFSALAGMAGNALLQTGMAIASQYLTQLQQPTPQRREL